MRHPFDLSDFMQRKQFLNSSLAAALSTSMLSAAKQQPLALGFDNFSIRAFGWKAQQLIEYAALQKVDSLLLSDLDVYENFDEGYLKELKQQARASNLILHAGTGSICGSSASFKDTHGSDTEHLKKTIRVAKALGSNVARCYLGSRRDRKGAGLEPHIHRVVEVCKAVKSYAKDVGVKIAIENHAGDMTAWQLKQLIERAGPEYVGATIDSGNAVWTMEDPVRNLEILAPYALSSGIRDTAVWREGDKIQAHWMAMGKGSVDWEAYFKIWRKVCPEIPVQLEIISQWGTSFSPKSDSKFWKLYPDVRDSDYMAFQKFSKRWQGEAPTPHPDRNSKEFMKRNLEDSLHYCRTQLGLGITT
jgi:sugar phosphate isomerase/epimerase